MRTTFSDQIEDLDRTLTRASELSKETIRTIVETSSKELSKAIDANQELLEMIKDQLQLKDLNRSVISSVKKSFATGIELSEQTIDVTIEAHTQRLQSLIEFNKELISMLKSKTFSSEEEVEHTINFLRRNFESSFNSSLNDLKTILDHYNKHVNVALNFNKKFANAVKSQIEEINRFQNLNMNTLTNWASEWWKNQAEKKEA